MITYEEKYRILRVAVVLGIEDIKCGFPEKAVGRLWNIVKALDKKPIEGEEDTGESLLKQYGGGQIVMSYCEGGGEAA